MQWIGVSHWFSTPSRQMNDREGPSCWVVVQCADLITFGARTQGSLL
jgi:hypothetical protein